MRVLLPVLVVIAAVAAGCSPVKNYHIDTSENITVLSAGSGAEEIDSTFAGFSYEKSILSKPFFTASNLSMIKLFRLLGPGVLRIGGNSVNKTSWGGPGNSGKGSKSGNTLTGDIDNLAEFLKASGWKVIYGLNGTSSPPELTASEAAYAASKLGDSLYGFEIGNEPDLYWHNSLEGSGFSFDDFINLWLRYYSSINSAITDHSPAFSGPATASDYKKYTVPFAIKLGTKVNLLTHHYYVANGTAQPRPTIDRLLTSLSPENNGHLLRELEAIKKAADSYVSGRYRIAEANSFYNGGAPDVSNNFGSALWALEFCFLLAQNGACGVNFHGGGNSTGYTPIANDRNGRIIEARAEYYGILLFSLVANGKLMKVEQTGGASSLYSYAVDERDGTCSLIIVNNSRFEKVDATVKFTETFIEASAMVLTAPNVDSTNGVTLGGSQVKPDGTWEPMPRIAMKVGDEGRSLEVSVAPGSAEWIKLTRN